MFLLRALRFIPLVWPLLRLVWRLFWDRRVPLAAKSLPVLAVVYVLSPLDLIPDIVPAVGRLDDLLVAALLLLAFIILSPRRVVIELVTGRPAPESGSPGDEGRTIDSQLRYEDKDARR